MDSITYQTDGRKGQRPTQAQVGPGAPDMQRPTRRQLRAAFDAADSHTQAKLRQDPEFARLFGRAGDNKRKNMHIMGVGVSRAAGPVSGTGKPKGE